MRPFGNSSRWLVLRSICVVSIVFSWSYLCRSAATQEPSSTNEISHSKRKLLATFYGEFVEITPGREGFPKTFSMGTATESGSDGIAKQASTHVVTFEYNFKVAKYELPQNLWTAVMGNNPSRWKGPRNSVEMFSFGEALQFCSKATKLMQQAKLIGPQQIIRLPSEAEWEYVARAGTNSAYSFGDKANDLAEYGWFNGNAAGNDPPVGAKKPNPWGLYDVHGYLWEWCADDWHASYRNAPTNGAARVNDTAAQKRAATGLGVLRGGSWQDAASKLTSGYRRSADRNLRDPGVGIRCVLADRDD